VIGTIWHRRSLLGLICLIALGIAPGWLGSVAWAEGGIKAPQSNRPVSPASDNTVGKVNEAGNGSAAEPAAALPPSSAPIPSLPPTQSSVLNLPSAIDVDAATATRLPLQLSRSVDDLPLGTCLRVEGLPTGASLSAGQANPGKGWIVPLWAMAELKIRLPPNGVTGDFDLVVALVDNHEEVIDAQTTRLHVKPTPADQDAKLSASGEPTPMNQPAGTAGTPPSTDQAAGAAFDPTLKEQRATALNKPALTGPAPSASRDPASADQTLSAAHESSPTQPSPATPSPAEQKQAVAEPPSSGAPDTTTRTVIKPFPDRPFELTSSEFRADRRTVSLDKQTGLPDNHRHITGIAVADRASTEFVMVNDLTNDLAAHASNSELQVYPTPGTGDLKSVRDVLTLPSTDLAIVSVPVMNKLRSSKAYGNIDARLALVGPLLTEELHLLALSQIQDLHGLAGQTISLGPKGGLAAILGHDILTALDVKANEVNLDLDAALEGMRLGKVTATLVISGKPVRALAERTATSGFHFLGVPYLPAFEKDLVRASLTHEDYPHLVPGADLETIGVPSALWAYRWPEQSERYRLVKLFLDRLTSHLPDLRFGASHPKWKDADLNASVPGWSHFDFAKGRNTESGKPNL
jgi:uncharacterized protein